MTYLFNEDDDSEQELGGEFSCFACYDVTDRATVNTKTGMLTYKCANGHVTELPWGVQEEIEVPSE